MIKLKREQKTLTVPNSLGNFGGNGGDCTEAIEEAYSEGFAEGEAEQKSKLATKFIVNNGTYEREDGWKKVTVAMPQPLIQDEKSVTLESPTAEIRPDGGAVAVRKVLVDATDLIDETFEEGKAAQKELMETLEIETVEGIYENEEGWNKVVVTRPEPTLVAVQSVYTYFDLGFIPQANDRIVARFSVDGKNPSMSGSDASIWGYYNGWMDNGAYMLCFSGTKIQSYCGRAYNQNITTITLGTPINVTYTPTLVTVDGTEGSLSANYVPQTTYNFWLGAASSANGSFRTPNAFTWYSFKVYRDDTLILDLVPAVNSDGYGCFKDTLTGTEYNAVNPSACTPIYDQNDYDRGYDDGKEAQKTLMTSLNVTSNGSYEREDGYNSITVNVQGASIVEMTQAEYDALTEYDDNIIYAIIG